MLVCRGHGEGMFTRRALALAEMDKDQGYLGGFRAVATRRANAQIHFGLKQAAPSRPRPASKSLAHDLNSFSQAATLVKSALSENKTCAIRSRESAIYLCYELQCRVTNEVLLMTLRADKPWMEIALIGVLLFFSIKFFLLTVAEGDLVILIPALLFTAMAIFVTTFANNEFRTFSLGDRLTYKGFFWGEVFVDPKELVGFKLKQRKNTTAVVPFDEYDILIFVKQNGTLTIRQANYDFEDMVRFKDQLQFIGVPFLGTETFSWAKSFKDLLRFKIFD